MSWDKLIVTLIIWGSSIWLAYIIKNEWVLLMPFFGAVLITINLWAGQTKKEK